MTPPRHEHFPRRRPLGRKLRRTVLIAVEGRETEYLYFDSLRRTGAVNDYYAVTVIRGKGSSRCSIVDAAVRKRDDSEDEYDETWLVLDTEQLTSPKAVADFRNARTLAKKHRFKVAVSNPSFEVWLLGHFVRSARPFADAGAVISELNRHWKTRFGRGYEKGDRAGFEAIIEHTQTAIKHAKVVREKDHAGKGDICKCNSATDLYLLVERLTSGGAAGVKGGRKRASKSPIPR